MSWEKVKIGEVLKQYRIEHRVQNDKVYKQVSILNDGSVVLRGEKIGKEIGRKRQFLIDVKKYPRTLIFTRQLLLQGSIGIAGNDVNGCIVTENMPMFSVDESKIDIEYLKAFLKSDVFRRQVRAVELTGSAQKSIHERTFLELEIPLPSIKEQEKVAKIFFGFKSKSTELSTELTHQQDLVKQLRQALLREAMQGKLTKQDAKDGNAKELLEKIKSEKQKNLPAGAKQRQEKPLPPIKEEEIPFEIPDNWVWCRLGEICNKIGSGSTPKGGNYSKSGFPFFRSQNIYSEGLVYDDITFVSDEVQNQMKGTRVIANDILLNITGGSLGRCALVPSDFKEGNVSQHVCIIRPIGIENEFLHNAILSPTFQKFIFNSTTGAGREGLPKYNLEQFPIPLPPLPEQKRIVKKLEELMKLCDELKTTITDNQNYTDMLLQVALKDALHLPAGKAGMKEVVTV